MGVNKACNWTPSRVRKMQGNVTYKVEQNSVLCRPVSKPFLLIMLNRFSSFSSFLILFVSLTRDYILTAKVLVAPSLSTCAFWTRWSNCVGKLSYHVATGKQLHHYQNSQWPVCLFTIRWFERKEASDEGIKKGRERGRMGGLRRKRGRGGGSEGGRGEGMEGGMKERSEGGGWPKRRREGWKKGERAVKERREGGLHW